MALCVPHVVGPTKRSLTFSTTRVVHVDHIRAVSPGPDHLVHLGARERWHKCRSFRGWRVFDASAIAFPADA
jgi:hypothetical protein